MTDFMTIQELNELCDAHLSTKFYIRNKDKLFRLGNLISYRGLYQDPAILLESLTYEFAHVDGREISKHLEYAIEVSHSGYKGGLFDFTDDQEFWVTNCQSDNPAIKIYKIIFKEIINEEECIVLLTADASGDL